MPAKRPKRRGLSLKERMRLESIQSETVSVIEAGRRLRIGRDFAYDAVHAGEIPSIRIGRFLRVPIADLERMFGKGEAPPPARRPSR